jgi:hypothetical protein
MKHLVFLLPFFLFLVPVNPAHAQFKNPRNLEFTWRTDTTRHSVDLSEITLVLPKGSFPKIDYPGFMDKKEGLQSFFPHEPVIAVEYGGEAKAYPLNMLTVHEISNDVLGGIPILATYCPLCNAGVVFDRRLLVDGTEQVLEFEVSGMLRKSDMVMLDTKTESLWQQFMGEAIVGSHTGSMLKVLPSLIISVEEFFTRYPEGKILSNRQGNKELEQHYGQNPYVGYDASGASPYSRFFAPEDVDSRLPAMERVIDIEVKGNYRIYPFSAIAKKGVLQDRFRGLDLVFFHGGETVSILDQKDISQSRTIGSVTVFSPLVDGKVLRFKKKGKHYRDEQSASTWDITGRCIKGSLQGTQLAIIPHSNHFAFAWLAFFPDSEIYGE